MGWTDRFGWIRIASWLITFATICFFGIFFGIAFGIDLGIVFATICFFGIVSVVDYISDTISLGICISNKISVPARISDIIYDIILIISIDVYLSDIISVSACISGIISGIIICISDSICLFMGLLGCNLVGGMRGRHLG